MYGRQINPSAPCQGGIKGPGGRRTALCEETRAFKARVGPPLPALRPPPLPGTLLSVALPGMDLTNVFKGKEGGDNKKPGPGCFEHIPRCST